jgi:hypothetical protein
MRDPTGEMLDHGLTSFINDDAVGGFEDSLSMLSFLGEVEMSRMGQCWDRSPSGWW